jgi:hypothetical protein
MAKKLCFGSRYLAEFGSRLLLSPDQDFLGQIFVRHTIGNILIKTRIIYITSTKDVQAPQTLNFPFSFFWGNSSGLPGSGSADTIEAGSETLLK